MRDPLAIETGDGEPWAGKTRLSSLQVRPATRLARENGKRELPPRLLAMIERERVRILEEAKVAMRAWSRWGLRGTESRVGRSGGPDFRRREVSESS